MDFEGLGKAFADSANGAVKEPVSEEQAPKNEPEVVLQEAPVKEIEQEAPVVKTEEAPVSEDAPVVKDEFPTEKFGGKFKSWEEVNEFISKPQEPSFKDDFIKKVVDTYNSNGNLEPFFKAYSTDWDNMDTNEVLKRKFFEENSADFDKSIIEKMWNKEQSKFDPDELDEDELEIYNAKRESDAKKFRQSKLAERENYLQPQQAPKQEIDVEAIRKTVNGIPEIKSLRDNGKIVLESGDGDFSYKVNDIENVAETIVDSNKFFDLFVQDGKPDPNKWIDVVAYAQNPKQMRQSLIDFGKSLGRSEIENELKNPSNPNAQPSSAPSYKTKEEGLLNAFAQKS